MHEWQWEDAQKTYQGYRAPFVEYRDGRLKQLKIDHPINSSAEMGPARKKATVESVRRTWEPTPFVSGLDRWVGRLDWVQACLSFVNKPEGDPF